MEKILVSILVLSYNSSKTIVETLNSIYAQTYKNIEIIISDDSSQDDTEIVVKKWMATHNDIPIFWYKMPRNVGTSRNCNYALEKANSEIVKMIAADDLLEANAIEIFLKYYLQQHSKTIWQSEVVFFGDALSDNERIEQEYLNLNRANLINTNNQTSRLLKQNFIIAPAIGLLNKKAIQQLGGFDERFRLVEDYPLYLKLSLNGYEFKLIDSPLVKYRRNNSSLSFKSDIMLKHECDIFFKIRFLNMVKHHMYKEAIIGVVKYSYYYMKSLQLKSFYKSRIIKKG